MVGRSVRGSKWRGSRSPAVCAEPLEERVLMAMSLRAGGSGFSNLLATDSAALRQQKLIIDPPEPLAGSASVLYDAKLVTLRGATAGPGYENQSFGGLVEVRNATGTLLQNLTEFLRQPAGVETGYVQVHYQLSGEPGQIAPPRDWLLLDVGGTEGDDTHALDFAVRPEVSSDNEFRYQVYAARQGEHSGNPEDFLITNDGTRTRLGPDQLSSAEASSRPKDGSVSGRTFFDFNANGVLDGDDRPLTNVGVFVDLNRDGKPETGEPQTVSNELGGYFFDNLAPGGYVVHEITPEGFVQTTDPAGHGRGVRIVEGQRVRLQDFGNARPGATSGSVFNDLNGDGVRQANEPGLTGAMVYVDYNNSATRDAAEPATTSDALGAWSMGSLPPGTFAVRQVPPSGFAQTAPAAGGAQAVTIVSGSTSAGVEFGDRTGPRVVETFVRGSAWTPSFLKNLAAQRLGADPAGFRVSAIGAAVPALPWTNVDQVVIRFDQPVNVDAADLVVHGARADYIATAVSLLPAVQNGYVFTLNRPLGGDGSAALNGDKLSLVLDGDPPAGVTGAGPSTGPMDGDADGQPGGDYRLRFDVLQGDSARSGRVDFYDYLAELQGYGAPAGAARYTPFRDVDGSGVVNFADVVLVRNRLGRFLPAVQAPASGDGPAPLALRPLRRSMFSDAPMPA